MLRLRAPLLSSLAAASAMLATACAPALDFDSLTSGRGPKTDASADGTVDAPEDSSSPLDAVSESMDAGSDSSSTDAPEEYAANPCANVASMYDGLYCGKSMDNGFRNGAPNTLYTCADGGVSTTKACSPDCIVDSPGYPDTCDECSTKPDGKWCGSEFTGFSSLLANVIFTCQSGVDIDMPTPTACSGAQPKCQPNDGGATCTP
jgi:hypothetical protein